MPGDVPPISYPLGRPGHGILGTSEGVRAVLHKIAVYGPADAPVLVTGETGTGKELVARAIHAESVRRNRPLLAMNCSAVGEELFESELFGHERGAFTGAVGAHRGRFERADGGTLFLDEIGDMPLRVQAKLLRVLEDGTFERVGGEKELRADVRIVAATNASLERGIAEGWFREDLFHRVAVLRIHTPPLRDRREDLPVLVEHFLASFNARYGRAVGRVSPEAMRALQDYAWPGNVRELRNVLERLYVEATSEVIPRSALLEWEAERGDFAAGAWNVDLREDQQAGRAPILIPPTTLAPAAPSRSPLRAAPRVVDMRAAPDGWTAAGSGRLAGNVIDVPNPGRTVRTARRPKALSDEAVREAFRAAEGNLTQAAAILGVHKTTLYRQMKRLKLDRGGLEGATPQ
ncbi:MAG: sigma-54 dependent transcriptional regulator [Planctomycetes bacterium]|nr:sigma-54 dependent transcriptional regulator [Planctomycetota bacterium]